MSTWNEEEDGMGFAGHAPSRTEREYERKRHALDAWLASNRPQLRRLISGIRSALTDEYPREEISLRDVEMLVNLVASMPELQLPARGLGAS